MLVTISADESGSEVLGYTVKTYYSPDTDGTSVDTLTGMVSDLVTYRNMINAGVSPDNFAATRGMSARRKYRQARTSGTCLKR